MKKKLLFLNLIVLLSLTSCGSYYEKIDSVTPFAGANALKLNILDAELNKIVRPFDTPIVLIRYQKGKNFEDISDSLDSNFKYYHAYFDRHYHYSMNGTMINNLAVINDNYGKNNFLEIPFELYDILKVSKELTILTKGKFNIGIGEISSLWDEYINNSEDNYSESVPSEEEIQHALRNVPNYQDIDEILELKEENNSYYVRFNKLEKYDNLQDHRISLSLGAIGKGYAVKKMEEVLDNKIQGYLSAGQSSISLLSESIGKTWNISLTNPIYSKKLKMDQDIKSLNTTEIKIHKHERFAFSTSGDYERFFYDSQQNIYHHIIDTTSGMPTNNFSSVSVVCSNSLYADALTTSLMTMNLEEGIAFVKEIEKTYAIDVYPMWLKEENNKIKAYVDNALKENVVLDKNESNSDFITSLEFVELNH